MAKNYEMVTVVNYVKSLNQEKKNYEVVTASVEEYLKKLAA